MPTYIPASHNEQDHRADLFDQEEYSKTQEKIQFLQEYDRIPGYAI
jgi:hypothetical protein